MRPEDMAPHELEEELARLHEERDELQRLSIVDDPEDDWGACNREIERVEKLLLIRRQA